MIENAYRGKEKVKNVRLQSLRKEFEKLEMKEDETIKDYFIRVTSVVNQMALNGEILEDARIVEKILRSLPAKFDYVVAVIEESNDISTFSMEEVQGKLEAHEIKIKLRNPSATQPDQALKSQVTTTGGNGNQASSPN